MINNLLFCAEQTIGDKLAEAGIVVLIGVSMVFVILFLLIGVVKLLQYLNKGLNNWDDIMAIYRANKAERKAIKKSYVDIKDEQINIGIIHGEFFYIILFCNMNFHHVPINLFLDVNQS